LLVNLVDQFDILSKIVGSKRIFGSVVGIFVGVVLMAYFAWALVHYQTWVYFNNLCREQSREQVAAIVSQYPECPELAPVDKACDRYLRGYLIGLSKAQASTGRAYEQTADQLVDGERFAFCIGRLNYRARLFEYVMQLPFLAEACERCAVAQCRRHTAEAKEVYQKSLTYQRSANTAALKHSYLLLAEQTEQLAMLFCGHEKFELADRSYQDSIASAGFATNLKDGGVRDAKILERYYLAYAAFLSSRHRDENALSTLEKMNELCGQ
jgi:hypothetical protein